MLCCTGLVHCTVCGADGDVFFCDDGQVVCEFALELGLEEWQQYLLYVLWTLVGETDEDDTGRFVRFSVDCFEVVVVRNNNSVLLVCYCMEFLIRFADEIIAFDIFDIVCFG